jgi:hypothetical protein
LYKYWKTRSHNKQEWLKDYYAYRLMIRRDQDNVILWCRELCQQFMVDIYVKIERKRFRYLRFNQNHVFHTNNYVACSQTIQFVYVGERWDNKKHCTLCCIKNLILFFTNIVIISDIYIAIALRIGEFFK